MLYRCAMCDAKNSSRLAFEFGGIADLHRPRSSLAQQQRLCTAVPVFFFPRTHVIYTSSAAHCATAPTAVPPLVPPLPERKTTRTRCRPPQPAVTRRQYAPSGRTDGRTPASRSAVQHGPVERTRVSPSRMAARAQSAALVVTAESALRRRCAPGAARTCAAARNAPRGPLDAPAAAGACARAARRASGAGRGGLRSRITSAACMARVPRV